MYANLGVLCIHNGAFCIAREPKDLSSHVPRCFHSDDSSPLCMEKRRLILITSIRDWSATLTLGLLQAGSLLGRDPEGVAEVDNRSHF